MNTVELAERASLGALLLEPSQVGVVCAWLRESDFLHPRSRIAYRLLATAASRGGGAGPAALLDLALGDPQARLNTVAGPYLHELMASPGGLGRSAVYARLVLQASVLRTLTDYAHDLARTARLTEQAPDSVPALVDAIRATHAHAQALQRRLEEADPAYLTQPAGIVGPPEPRPWTLPDQTGLEAELVDAIADNPDVIDRIRGWLTADDFATGPHASTYASMLALARAGMPIDHVTTQWNRRDQLACSEAVPAHLVATRTRCTSHETVRLARQLLARSVGTRTRAAADAIAALDHDPVPSSRQRLRTAIHRLDRLLLDTARWFEPGHPAS